MFYFILLVGLLAVQSPGFHVRHNKQSGASVALTHVAGVSRLRPNKFEIPTFWLLGIGAVVLLGLLGLTCWLLQTRRVTREVKETIRVQNSGILLSCFSGPSWGVSTLDLVVPPKVSVLGTWDFTEDGADGILRGFYLFYPGGGSHIEYTTGWSSRNFKYELKGYNGVGTIEDLGQWDVTFAENGMKGKGKIGPNQLHMIKRCQDYQQADEFYQGTWDIWMQKEATWLGFFTMDATGGYVEFENGVSSGNWSCEVSGMFVRSVIPGQGPLCLEFAPDGSIGVATIGSTKYHVWRRD